MTEERINELTPGSDCIDEESPRFLTVGDLRECLVAIITLQSELREARRDTERLDWLIKQGPPGASDWWGEAAWEQAITHAEFSGPKTGTDALAMRAALDAAMTPTPPTAMKEGGAK